MTCSYLEVPAEAVPPEILRLASQVLEVVCWGLSIPRPALRWYAPGRATGWFLRTFQRDARSLGFVNDAALHELWLRSELSARQAVVTVLHEAIHLSQFWTGAHRTLSHEEREQRAHESSESIATAWGW